MKEDLLPFTDLTPRETVELRPLLYP